ncbi:hypothetical protein B6N58_13395 [Legionella micdadei]|nr:hypothetical protein B6N58_13395 [Legionella micdadei]ARH01315.1 hypothetical protein B6V88_13405 [Legionella micdadei]
MTGSGQKEIQTTAAKQKRLGFFTNSDKKYGLEQNLVCQMNKTNLVQDDHTGTQGCSVGLYELIARNQNNPDWSISLFDTCSDGPVLLLNTQTVLRGEIPHLKQDGMGIFIFSNCNGRIALEEQSLEYCIRLVIANTKQRIVVDSHLQIAVSEIDRFLQNDLKELSDYLKKYQVNLLDIETQISIIYGPKPDYLTENEYAEGELHSSDSENEIPEDEIPGILIAFMLEETLGKKINLIKGDPGSVSQIDLSTGLIYRSSDTVEVAYEADDEFESTPLQFS